MDVHSRSNVRQSRWNADHEAVNSNLAWYLSVYLSSAEFLVYAAVVVFASFVVVGTALVVVVGVGGSLLHESQTMPEGSMGNALIQH